MIEEKLLSILICPACKGPLVYREDHNELWSKDAGLAYEIKDDIPVMIPAEARSLTEEEQRELE